MKKLCVMVSGGGTDLQSVIDGIEAGRIDGKIVLVVSNKAEAYALTRAEKAGIPTKVIERKAYASKKEYFAANLSAIQGSGAEGIILAGYLSILSKELVEAYRGRIINIHPALIPSFCGKGFYGDKVHQAVLDYGVKVTGVTVHFVDEEPDGGPIIAQRAVSVLEGDTVESLRERVLAEEHRLLPEVTALFCAGRIVLNGRNVTIKQ